MSLLIDFQNTFEKSLQDDCEKCNFSRLFVEKW